MTVQIRNARDLPIYLGPALCTATPFSLTRVADQSEVVWAPDACEMTCEDVLAGSCSFCGACPDTLSTIRVDPGAVWSVAWDGAAYATVAVPAGCVSLPCSETCTHRVAGPPEPLMLSARAGTACVGDCDCPEGQNACDLNVDEVPGAQISAEGEFTPDGTVFELVFE
jgi:hypothetical protein